MCFFNLAVLIKNKTICHVFLVECTQTVARCMTTVYLGIIIINDQLLLMTKVGKKINSSKHAKNKNT